MSDLSGRQLYLLEQMGVVSWVSSETPIPSHVDFLTSPWPSAHQPEVSSSPSAASSFQATDAFQSQAKPAAPVVSEEEKDRSVASLRQQLTEETEVIVEDLQPIVEKAVDVEVVEDVADAGSIPTSVRILGYCMGSKLLLLTDVPLAMDSDDGVDQLALSLSRALLKTGIDEWQRSQFQWPGPLKNPHLRQRSDWALGAFSAYLAASLKSVVKPESDELPWCIISGEQVQAYFEESDVRNQFPSLKVANIDSLTKLLRIPALRKEAWLQLQHAFH